MTAVRHIEMSDKCRLAVEVLGERSNPPLIFSNSLGTTREMWRSQADALSQSHHVILYDTRGHGQSEAPEGAYSIDRLSLDVLEIMDTLEIERALFCGLSLGGMTGQVLACKVPARFPKMVLAATSAYMGPPSGWQTRIDTVLRGGMRAISDAVRSIWFAPEGQATSQIVERAVAWFKATDPIGYAGCCAAIRDMDLRGIGKANTCRTLILAGEDDMATPPEHAHALKASIASSELKLMRGGHLLNLEQPAAFSEALIQFFGD